MTDGESDKPPNGGCRHYWIIQPATGPVSQGSCQTCGETREFKNYPEDATWSEEHKRYRAQLDPDDREVVLAC